MKSAIIVSLALALLPTYSFAKSLRCDIKENESIVSSKQIETMRNKKIEFGQSPNVIAYVTEYDNGNFTLEGFLVNYDARFYGAGVLKTPTDSLIASIWTRQVLIDIQCKPLN